MDITALGDKRKRDLIPLDQVGQRATIRIEPGADDCVWLEFRNDMVEFVAYSRGLKQVVPTTSNSGDVIMGGIDGAPVLILIDRIEMLPFPRKARAGRDHPKIDVFGEMSKDAAVVDSTGRGIRVGKEIRVE